MPIYEYVCNQCGKVNDVLQKMSDPPPEACEACHRTGTLNRVVSRTSFVLKGGGWYSDLYSSTKKDGGGATGSATKGGGDAAAGASTASTAPASAPAPAAAASPTSGEKK